MFFAQAPGIVTAVTFYYSMVDMAGAAPHSCALFHVNGTLLAQAQMRNESLATADTPDGWLRCDFASPIRLVPKDNYIAMLRTNKFIYTLNYWSSYGVDSGVLVGVHGRVVNYGGAVPFTYPTMPTANTYWIDIIFKQDTLSLPTLLTPTATPMSTTQTDSATTILSSMTTTSTMPTVASSTDLTVLSAASPTSSVDLTLVGILVGVALFVQCVILAIAIYLFVKWKKLRLSTPSNNRESAAPELATAGVYADASEVRQSSIGGSAATIRTHEYSSATGAFDSTR